MFVDFNQSESFLGLTLCTKCTRKHTKYWARKWCQEWSTFIFWKLMLLLNVIGDLQSHDTLVFGPPFMKFCARKCCQKLCTFILRPLTFLCRCKSTWLIHLTIRYPFLMGSCRLGFNYAFLTLSLLWNSSLHASNSSMSHEVLIVSLSSAYFHLERSYLADARACCCWTTTEERFNCWGTGDKLEKRQKTSQT